MPSKSKSAKVSISIPADEKKQWMELARESHKSMSRFIADAVRADIEAKAKISKELTDLQILRDGITEAEERAKKKKLKPSKSFGQETDKSLTELIGEYVEEEE